MEDKTRYTLQGLMPLNADLWNSCLLVDSLVQEIYATEGPQQSFTATQPNKFLSCFRELLGEFGFKIMIQHVQVG